MTDTSSPFLIARRSILVFAGAGLILRARPAWASDSDFWDKKPPAEWSSDEIDRLLTHSPWAKPVTAEAGSSEEGGSRGGGLRLPGGIGFPGGGGGGGMGRGRGGRSGGGGRSSASQPKGTVRWESAKPILEALRINLPESFANHYVISVNGFPMQSGFGSESHDESAQASQDMLDHLKAYTSLQPKDKPIAQPGVVEPQPAAGAPSFLFGFSKEILALGPDDREVAFSTRLGRHIIKAKFSLKEMSYRGGLAL